MCRGRDCHANNYAERSFALLDLETGVDSLKQLEFCLGLTFAKALVLDLRLVVRFSHLPD